MTGDWTFNLPDLGEGLEDAEVVRWLIAEGDDVALNQPICEADTAKALVEIPSPVEGKVTRLHASEGDVVKVGAPLVTFEVTEEMAKGRKSVLVGYGVEEEAKPARRRRLRGRRTVQDAAGESAGAQKRGASLASPPVRRLAKEKGVDLHEVRGSGPGGRITREDVLSAAEAAPAGTVDEERVAVRGVRRLVAQKMARSYSEIPHVTTFLDVDCTELLKAREAAQTRAGEGMKVTALAVIAKEFLEVCAEYPKLNASFDADAQEIVLKRRRHLGIATDTDEGLMVPVIRDADRLSAVELAKEIARLAEAARGRTASPEEMSGSTVTISNVGSFGATHGTPIVNYPESAILATGVIAQRPVALGGKVEVRPMVTMSLSFDHRVLDGAEAGRALLSLKNRLENL